MDNLHFFKKKNKKMKAYQCGKKSCPKWTFFGQLLKKEQIGVFVQILSFKNIKTTKAFIV